ncbi:MAG: dihydroorotate dehydrogenase electron transfer subunit [Thermodesulfobacteriota bacterium]
MSAIKLEAEVLRNEKITRDVYRLTMLAPAIAEGASPGQFVMVKANKDFGSPLLRRPFSIHRAMENGRIEILFKTIGKGTAFLATRQSGDILSLVGPLGRGFTLPSQPANICIVGGGMGIAPLFYLTKQLLRSNIDHQAIKVFLGAATASEIAVLENDFASLGVTVKIATDDGSTGHHGLVTELLSDNLDQTENWQIYSCGPHPMMKAIASYCLARKWSCQVSLETLMACGISACLGCAIRGSAQGLESSKPYLHVCKDGPVFAAGDVAWE